MRWILLTQNGFGTWHRNSSHNRDSLNIMTRVCASRYASNAMYPFLRDRRILMEQRRLGSSGPQVSAIGLGTMSLGLSDVYTSSAQDESTAVELIHRALDLGVNFLDTANIYGDSEIKVGKALRGRRESV